MNTYPFYVEFTLSGAKADYVKSAQHNCVIIVPNKKPELEDVLKRYAKQLGLRVIPDSIIKAGRAGSAGINAEVQYIVKPPFGPEDGKKDGYLLGTSLK